MKRPSATQIGICLTLIGVGPFVFVEYKGHAHNWRPLDVPVALTPGEFRSPEFKTDLNGRYVVSLGLDQLTGADRDRALCLLGVKFPRTELNCDGIPQRVKFEWQVVSEKGEIIQRGSYEPLGISFPEINWGEFHGGRNIRQRLLLRIQQDAIDLNSHHPRLIVEAGGDEENFEALALWYELSLLWAAVVGVSGLLLVVLSVSNRVRKRS